MKHIVCFMALCFMSAAALATSASPVQLYVDSAPNVFGSPNWAPWWSAAKNDVVSGNFQNLSNGTFPGTLTIDAHDEIVYLTGDRGKRIHWIYWLPGSTIAELNGNLELKYVVDWQGTAYTFDWNTSQLAEDTDELGWFPASAWTNYGGGVIGNFGHAWMAYDNLAAAFDTNNDDYDETDAADIEALSQQVFNCQTFATGLVRWRNSSEDTWEVSALSVQLVPVPMAVWEGVALLGVCFVIRSTRRTMSLA